MFNWPKSVRPLSLHQWYCWLVSFCSLFCSVAQYMWASKRKHNLVLQAHVDLFEWPEVPHHREDTCWSRSLVKHSALLQWEQCSMATHSCCTVQIFHPSSKCSPFLLAQRQVESLKKQILSLFSVSGLVHTAHRPFHLTGVSAIRHFSPIFASVLLLSVLTAPAVTQVCDSAAINGVCVGLKSMCIFVSVWWWLGGKSLKFQNSQSGTLLFFFMLECEGIDEQEICS